MTGQGVSDLLRDVADWLDANPDLEVTGVNVSIASRDGADLKRVARALGGNPRRVTRKGDVWLESQLLTYPDPFVRVTLTYPDPFVRVTSGHVPAVHL